MFSLIFSLSSFFFWVTISLPVEVTNLLPVSVSISLGGSELVTCILSNHSV